MCRLCKNVTANTLQLKLQGSHVPSCCYGIISIAGFCCFVKLKKPLDYQCYYWAKIDTREVKSRHLRAEAGLRRKASSLYGRSMGRSNKLMLGSKHLTECFFPIWIIQVYIENTGGLSFNCLHCMCNNRMKTSSTEFPTVANEEMLSSHTAAYICWARSNLLQFVTVLT